jgi:hypothetical protein
MSNIDILRDKVKFHIRDVNNTDDEIDNIILQVISDIALTTKIFKKIYGFSIHKDIELYDFNAILQMNERTEHELSSVTIGSYSQDQIKDFLSTSEFPSPPVEKVIEEETAKNKLLNVINIFDDEIREMRTEFRYLGTHQYKLYDESYREENDGMHCVFTAQIIPHIDELLPETIEMLSTAIIAGTQYYFLNTMNSADDVQISNVYYQRFYAKQLDLIDHMPTFVYGVQSTRGARKWL